MHLTARLLTYMYVRVEEEGSGCPDSAAISAWLTASHPSSEVEQVRAGVVLRRGTTREGPVPRFLFLLSL